MGIGRAARATSGKNLIDIIRKGKADIITTIINKFNTVEKSGLKVQGKDIFVLVDESHRSNYGELAMKMRVVFPNACYIGFTGTPLMKNEKNALTKFGKIIHKYTIKDGVEDKAIVPLIYEGKFVEQKVDEENIDLWFEQTTKRLNDKQKIDLKRKWSSMKQLASTETRIKRIALDINNHFAEGYQATGFKAMIATNRKRDAVSYLACFEQFGDLTCEVCISPPDIREGVDDIDEEADDRVITYWNKMMKRYGDADSYEDSVKNRFIDGDIDILIVCSKLLTGFDAPLCQVLYIDKELKEHGLLQAIARTNRLYEGKDYGLIVDYRGLIQELDEAMSMYSGAGLENFESCDLKGTIVDIISVVANLRQSYTRLEDLFMPVKNKKDPEEIEIFLADEEIREEFYRLLCRFGKDLSVILNSEKAYQSMPEDECARYREAFGFYSKVRRSVKILYCDSIDHKEYEKQMQNLLDTHLSVVGLKQITAPVDIMNRSELEKELQELGTLRAKADAIRFRMAKNISEKYEENPAYYESFSKRIKDTLQQYKEKIITDAEYLAKMRTIMEDYTTGVTDITYPDKLKNDLHAQAFYGVVGAILFDELDKISQFDRVAEESIYHAGRKQTKQELVADLALEITKIIEKHSKVDWTHNTSIHDRIDQDIDDFVYRKQEYIFHSQKKYKAQYKELSSISKRYVSGESVDILGKSLRLKVIEGEEERIWADGIFVFLSVKEKDDLKRKAKLMNDWIENLRRETFSQICKEVYQKFKKYGVLYPELRIRYMSSRWGSCQPEKGVITLNSKLIEAPRRCIEYVVLHEFVHFISPDHSRKFYNFMMMLMPDWEERKTELERGSY